MIVLLLKYEVFELNLNLEKTSQRKKDLISVANKLIRRPIKKQTEIGRL